jgi:hypothetical protein
VDVWARVSGASEKLNDQNATTTQATRSFMGDSSFRICECHDPFGTECLTCKARTEISAIISRFHPCHAEIGPLGRRSRFRFRLFRGEFAAAKWAGIKPHGRVTHQHGRALPLDRHLGANRTAGGVRERVRAEEACPLSQPLVESFRTVPLYWPRMLRQSTKKGQSFVFKSFQKL